MEHFTHTGVRSVIAASLGLSMMLAAIFGAYTLPAQAQGVSLRDFVELLISLGIISSDKAAQARLAVGGSTTTGTIANVPSTFRFTRNLSLGARGVDVLYLQRILNTAADTQVALGGSGSAGLETEYFGSLTRSAVIRFQNKYRAEILTPLGLFSGTGFVGVATRAKLNAMIAAGAVVLPPVVVIPPPGPTPPPPPASNVCTISTPGVEGTLSATQTNSGLPSTIYENDRQVGVLAVRLEAKNSDICVQRVKVDVGTDTRIYNKILSKMYITDGTSVFASTDLNSSTVVKEGSRYYVTLSGFNFFVPRNSTRNIVVKADVYSTIDSTDIDNDTYTVRLASSAIRGIDGAGIDQYAGDTTITRNLTISASLSESATLNVSLNTSSPKKADVMATGGSSENEIDKLTVLTFDVRAERDDVKITDIVFDIEKSGSGGATASTTVYLFEGSTELDSASISTRTATFSDVDYVVPRNTTRTLTAKVDIRNANATIARFVASTTASGITSENTRGEGVTESGSATGYSIGVRSVGPEVTLLSSSIVTAGSPQSNGVSTNVSTSTLTATFNVRIKAVGGALTFGTVASGTPAFASSTTGFKIYRNGSYDSSIGSYSTTTSYTTPSGVTTSGLTESFTLAEGSTVDIPVTFRIIGRNTNGVSLPDGVYAVGLEGVQWNTGAGGSSFTTNFMAGEADWRTSGVSFP